MTFEHMPHRHPIHSGRFHRYNRATALPQPIPVGSRAGAVLRRRGLSVSPRFLWECLTSRTVSPFPAPATSLRDCHLARSGEGVQATPCESTQVGVVFCETERCHRASRSLRLGSLLGKDVARRRGFTPESLNSPRTASVNSGSRSWMRYRLPRRNPSHMSVRFLATCFILSLP